VRTPIPIVLALGCFLAAAAPGCAGARDDGPKRVEAKLTEGAVLKPDPENQTVRFLRGPDLSAELEADPAFSAARRAGDAEGVARAYLQHYAELFRLDDPRSELSLVRVDLDRFGTTHVRFEQRIGAYPIPGAHLNVHLDRSRRVAMANGVYVPTPKGFETTPKLSEADARAIAARETGAPCDACAVDAVVFAEGASEPRLAWRVAPPADRLDGSEVILDAQDGAVLRKQPLARKQQRAAP
jgi:Zn-dependent metalloprotease